MSSLPIINEALGETLNKANPSSVCKTLPDTIRMYGKNLKNLDTTKSGHGVIMHSQL